MDYKITYQARETLREILTMLGIASWGGKLNKPDIVFIINELSDHRDEVASRCSRLRPDGGRSKEASVDKELVDHVMRVIEARRVEGHDTTQPHGACISKAA